MDDKDYLWLNLRDLPYFRAMLRAVEAKFYQQFELSAPTLDVGCGDGHFGRITSIVFRSVWIQEQALFIRQLQRWLSIAGALPGRSASKVTLPALSVTRPDILPRQDAG
jgi:hypothetical protein